MSSPATRSEPPGARLLIVGGLDPCGGAGITADARVAARLSVFPLTVATCLTVQNRHGFAALHGVADPILAAMLRAVIADGPIDAVKVGLVGGARRLELVLEICAQELAGVPVVVDPVLSATVVGLATGEELVAAYRCCIAVTSVLTPNQSEADRLAPDGIESLVTEDCAVLLKDGHGAGDTVEDRLLTVAGVTMFRHQRLARGQVHGTGCALATAVAANLARGGELESACRQAVEQLVTWLRGTAASRDGLPVPLRIS